MTVKNGPPSPADGAPFPRLSLRRLAPLVVLVVVSVGVIAFGWHRQLSFEEVARHHEALGAFIARHELQAVAAYIVLYVTAAALSMRTRRLSDAVSSSMGTATTMASPSWWSDSETDARHRPEPSVEPVENTCRP